MLGFRPRIGDGDARDMTSWPPTDPLEVFLFGEIPPDDALTLQRRLVYDRGERGGGALILCEHSPTITVGRSGSRTHIVPDDDELREMRLPVRWTGRGGGCVLHLPGQLAAYLVVSVDSRGTGDYLGVLQRVILGVLAEFDLPGILQPERPGVFVRRSRIASIGIALTRGVAHHGFTLNVGPYLAPFELLDEPGLNGRPLRQTSIEAQIQRTAPMSRVREAVVRLVESELGLERRHVYTDHSLIRRKVRPHVHVAHLG